MEGEEDEATMLMVMEATGLDQEAALLLLADHKWDSQLAIETFFAVPTPTSPRCRPSEGRLPPHLQNPSSSFETLGADSLLETNYQRANSKATTKTTSRSKKKKPIVEVFRDFSQERGKKKGNNKKAESLSELFRPPVELIFPGSFEEAKAFASQQKRLLVVALIHFDIFDCQRMNRDTWKHHQVADLLREDFVFWQAYSGESESVLYESFYSKNGLPHTSVLDPMTGERLGSWDGFVDGPQMASELQRVLCEFVPQQQEEKKMARGKQKKYESEEEQFERAVRESLQELKNDPIKGDPANLFDSDYDNPSEEYDFDYDSSPFGFEEEERGKEERGKEERGKEEREGEEREEEQRVTENGEGKKEEERGKEDRKRRRDGGRLKGEEEEDGRREESKKKRKIEEEKERNREEKREKGKGGKREEEMKKREEIKEEKEVRKEEKRGQEEEERKKENGEIKVDPSRPTISLQVRLVNGKKITIEANTFHTISDLYSHILAHKENRTKSFTLATSFPKRELKDKDQDLETAGLAKALIVQHPK